MSLSNSISLIADTYYTLDEEILVDLTSLIISSTTILDEDILHRKADKVDVNDTFLSKVSISDFNNTNLAN